MSYRSFFVISILASFLAGCGTLPKTADNVVESVNANEIYSKKDTFEVKQPLSKVAAVLKEKSAECFRKRTEHTNLQATGIGTTGYRTTTIDFTPHVLVTRERVRLTVQLKDVSTGNINVGPDEGWYVMVVDAYPVNKQTTRVESYFRNNDHEAMQPAVKSWLTGNTAGCPDLSS